MKTRNLAILLISLVIFTNCFAQKENKKNKKGKTETIEEVKTTVPEVTQESAPRDYRRMLS